MKPSLHTFVVLLMLLPLLLSPGVLKAEVPSARLAATSPADPTAISDVHDFLPNADELKGSWTVNSEGARTREEVIELLGERGEDLIDSLGWRANAFRNFDRMNITDPDSLYEPTLITVSIHAFAASEGAADALHPLAQWVAYGDGMEAVPVDGFGDNALAFSGLDGRLPIFVLYVQVDNLVIRVGATSMLGDPRDAVVEVTELVLEKVKG